MDEPGEPCCTGPSESSDDHELRVMHLVKMEHVDVAPKYGSERAQGRLIMPNNLGVIDEEARLVLGKSVAPERKIIILGAK